MNNPWLKHLIAFALMLLVTCIVFSPMLSGKKLVQSDNLKAQSIMSELKEFKAEHGRVPLWTNRNFSGMPAYQILSDDKTNYTAPIFEAFLAGQGVASAFAGTFLAMLMMYFFMMVLGVDWRVALGGAVAYAASNYFVDLSEAGHSTKLVALAYLPAIFAAAVIAFRGRYLLGGTLMALFTALQFYANHVQITYYTFLILAIYGLISLIRPLIFAGDEPYSAVFKRVALGGVALLFGIALAMGANASKLWTTLEYQKETTRSQSELSGKTSDGLGIDYANDWSLGLQETFTLLIPNYSGGGGSLDYTNSKSEIYSLLKQNLADRVPPNDLDRVASQQLGATLYWGDQPFVGVPIYFGAVVMFLFMLGLITVRGDIKWWLFATFIFSLIVSWGDHTFIGVMLFNYFPFYNKFRAVTMALGIGQFAAAALGLLALQQFLSGKIETAKMQSGLIRAAGITAGITILAMLFAGSMTGKNDENLKNVIGLVLEQRRSILRMDVFRTLMFIGAAFGVLWFYLKGSIKPAVAALAIVGLIAVDMIMIDKRSLNSNDFSSESDAKIEVEPSQVDKEILADKSLSYRVLDLSKGSPFTNSAASAFHQNIGGYHAAKLMIYQELIDSILFNPSAYPNVLNMLNVKYIITKPDQKMTNLEVLGNAWFVKNIKVVDNADQEIVGLRNLDTRNDVIIQKKFAASLAGFTPQYDSTNTITLTAYEPDKLTYNYSAKTDQLAVFSEIYYPEAKGWHLYLNGKRITGLMKANYVLRAAKLPAGQNQKLEMVFEPESYYTGNKISAGASIATILLTIGGLFMAYRSGGFGNMGGTLPDDTLPKAPTPTRTPARESAPERSSPERRAAPKRKK